ncbi:RND transporter, partial [Nannocystis sp. ILAH1]
RLPEVVHVRRPAFVQPDATMGLFVVDADGAYATRVPVQIGRLSATTVEVVAGLSVGDRVILSDMTQWDATDRVKFE